MIDMLSRMDREIFFTDIFKLKQSPIMHFTVSGSVPNSHVGRPSTDNKYGSVR